MPSEAGCRYPSHRSGTGMPFVPTTYVSPSSSDNANFRGLRPAREACLPGWRPELDLPEIGEEAGGGSAPGGTQVGDARNRSGREVTASGSPRMAEGLGFEPRRAVARPAGFQDRCLRPLGHPSARDVRESVPREAAGPEGRPRARIAVPLPEGSPGPGGGGARRTSAGRERTPPPGERAGPYGTRRTAGGAQRPSSACGFGA